MENEEIIKMKFEQRVQKSIKEMIAIGYRPQALITMMMRPEGSVNAVKQLINSEKIPEGFTKLWELKRLDLSMENIIQENEWHELFTEDERNKAKKRLKDYGFIK
jgi:hypothetical protein